jgi:hypothetical protein
MFSEEGYPLTQLIAPAWRDVSRGKEKDLIAH